MTLKKRELSSRQVGLFSGFVGIIFHVMSTQINWMIPAWPSVVIISGVLAAEKGGTDGMEFFALEFLCEVVKKDTLQLS